MTAESGLSARTAVSFFLLKRTSDHLDGVGLVDQTGAGIAAQHSERKPGGAGHIAVRHARVGMFLDFQR
ncbi:hypothetical protein [Fodinicola feengrottensis]|uniref:hypothetical protein n=1 Tax=Fodinicola feengrottensis TaxID=435914 RepID=UPI002442E991|nr:hypothetical protein [Fodinicola feengrottensis]